MLSHFAALLLLLVAVWYYISPLRRRCLRLKRERTELRQRLTAQQQSMDTMLGQLKDMVVRMDRQGRVLWANPRAKKILPLPATDAAASSKQPNCILSMTQMQRDPDWGKRLQQALDQLPEPSKLPTLHMDNNGTESLLSFSLEILPLGDDQALLLCNDITERLRQERQKDELLANLMHDLKTPLTNLIGYSETLKTLGDNKQIREEAGAAIARGAKRVNRLLDALMALASSTQKPNSLPPSCNPIDVTQLVIDGIKDSANLHHVTLSLQADSQANHVMMTATSFERMLFNVVENGINHAPSNTAVTITLSQVSTMLQIQVADQGCGVAKEHLPRLTERFYRLDSSRSQGGHGLGLAIVAEQIKLCGGSMTIRNNLPTGLLVTLNIPLSLPDDN
ncbi:MAG: ATP-binding protein [Mariprofundales bacterium]